MKTNIVERFELCDSIPHGYDKNNRTRDKVLEKYYYLVAELISIAQRGEREGHEVSIYFGKFDGSQAFFEVRALDLPDKGEYNWYGQNTSQWLYAGCIQVSKDGMVSVHT